MMSLEPPPPAAVPPAWPTGAPPPPGMTPPATPRVPAVPGLVLPPAPGLPPPAPGLPPPAAVLPAPPPRLGLVGVLPAEQAATARTELKTRMVGNRLMGE